ncbi:MAG: riboflavin synthase subunit alpha [Myxococcota bacterium]|nr:riboflavin synthase subunit alpha [Myxococcota bacterium]
MFTGITRGTFEVTRIDKAPDLLTFEVDLGENLSAGLEIGASVLIDGVCQTVTGIAGPRVRFQAIRETLDRTTLGDLVEGGRVSVERSARVGDEIGGHDVSGHVTGTGCVSQVRREGDVCDVRIEVPDAWMKYILFKGFVAVDGSSLTVGERSETGSFTVHLIPETLRLTLLGDKAVGDRVNVELDPRTVAIVETVERVLAQREGSAPGGGEDR